MSRAGINGGISLRSIIRVVWVSPSSPPPTHTHNSPAPHMHFYDHRGIKSTKERNFTRTTWNTSYVISESWKSQWAGVLLVLEESRWEDYLF